MEGARHRYRLFGIADDATVAAEGLSGPQIAERVVVRASTTKTHFENIYEKLGVGDRAGAVAYALRLGVISEPAAGGCKDAAPCPNR